MESLDKDIKYIQSFKHKDSNIEIPVEEFAYCYTKYAVLCQTSSSAKQTEAYNSLSEDLNVPVTTVQRWTNMFRTDFYHRMLELAMKSEWPYELMKNEPKWVRDTEVKLKMLPGALEEAALKCSNMSQAALTPDSMLRLLVAYSKRHRALCSKAFYNDIKRTLRLSCGLAEIHSIWVYAQNVALQVVKWHIRGGDVITTSDLISETNWQVAELVLLYTDVHSQRLVTDESFVVFEELQTLTTLFRLVHKYGAESAHTEAERASQWTQIYEEYVSGGRKTSIVILQRRWHELKLHTRARLMEYLRCDGDTKFPEQIHVEIAKKYPSVLTSEQTNWCWQAARGLVVLEPHKEKRPTDLRTSDSSDADSHQDGKSSDDDVLLIEKPIETMEVDSDNDYCDVATENQAKSDAATTENYAVPNDSERRKDLNNIMADKDRGTPCLQDVSDNNTSKSTDDAVKMKDLIQNVITQTYRSPNADVPVRQETSTTEVIERLQALDPLKVKVQIIFDSSDSEETCDHNSRVNENSRDNPLETEPPDESLPIENKCEEENNILLKALLNKKKEMNFGNKIFGGSSANYVRRDSNSAVIEQGGDANLKSVHSGPSQLEKLLTDERRLEEECTPQVDPKLIMNTKVELVRLHDTECWKKYSTMEKYIRLDRIDRKQLQTANQRVKHMGADDMQLQSAEDLLALKVEKENSIPPTYIDNIDCLTRKRSFNSMQSQSSKSKCSKKSLYRRFESDSSTDEEMPLSAIYRPLARAAAWKVMESGGSGEPQSADSSNLGRKSKRVKLPDIDEVRRTNQKLLTAEVVPISTKQKICHSRNVNASGDHARPGITPRPTPSDLDPNRLSYTGLQTVLNKLSGGYLKHKWTQMISRVEYCCLARRNYVFNDARKRISASCSTINLHIHADNVCKCCCSHLLDEATRRQKLNLEVNALQDILRTVLKKSSFKPQPELERTKIKKYRRKYRRSLKNAQETSLRRSPEEHNSSTTGLSEWERQKMVHKQYFDLNLDKTIREKTKKGSNIINKESQSNLTNKSTHTGETLASHRDAVNDIHSTETNESHNSIVEVHKTEDTASDLETKSAVHSSCASETLLQAKSTECTGLENTAIDVEVENKPVIESGKKMDTINIKQTTNSAQVFSNPDNLGTLINKDKQINRNALAINNVNQKTMMNHATYINVKDVSKTQVQTNVTKIVNLLFVNEKSNNPTEKIVSTGLEKHKPKDDSAERKTLSSGDRLEPHKLVVEGSCEQPASSKKGTETSYDGLVLYRRKAPKITLDYLLSICAPSMPVLLRTDAARPPVMLPGGYLMLTEWLIPCTLPTYWTLAPYQNVARVVSGKNKNKNWRLSMRSKEIVQGDSDICLKPTGNIEKLDNANINFIQESTKSNKVTGEIGTHETNNEIIHIFDDESNDVDSEKNDGSHNSCTKNDVSSEMTNKAESANGLQQDFTNFIKITNVVGGFADFTTVTVNKVATKTVNENVAKLCRGKSVLEHKPLSSTQNVAFQSSDHEKTNDECEFETNEIDQVTGSKALAPNKNRDDAFMAQTHIDSKSEEKDKVDDIDEDNDDRLIIDEKCSVAQPRQDFYDTEHSSINVTASKSLEPKNVVIENEIVNNLNTNISKDRDPTIDKTSQVKDNTKDMISNNVGKPLVSTSVQTELCEKNSGDSDVEIIKDSHIGVNSINSVNSSDKHMEKCNVVKDPSTGVVTISSDRHVISTVRELSGVNNGEITGADGEHKANVGTGNKNPPVRNQISAYPKILTAFSDYNEWRKMFASTNDMFLMNRESGNVLPMRRICRRGLHGIASSVPKETLIALTRIINTKSDTPAPSNRHFECPIVDITDD